MKPLQKLIPVLLSGSVGAVAFAAPPPQGPGEAFRLQQEQLIREQQRQDAFREQMRPDAEVRPGDIDVEGAGIKRTDAGLPQGETPCFAVREIVLTGDSASRFRFALRQAVSKSGFKPGMCLGAEGINRLMTLAQNAVIARGYTTTRIMAAPQDLNSGKLELTVIPGRIHEIRFDTEHEADTHVDRIRSFHNEFPAKAGDVLNLRALEQGLENLKRLPTVEADIRIVPAEAPDESDVVVSWKQRTVPWRLTLNADDSGSHSTGRYQAGVTVSADNLLGLSDMFYANYNRDIGGKDSYQDEEGRKTDSGTQGYAFHYSVPAGNWLFAFNHNYYRYHQAVAGLYQNYDYNGNSATTDFGISRLLYRDARRKTNLTAKLWRRESQNFIDDAEITVQRRRTAGWMLSLDHKEYLGDAVLTFSGGYKRGTGAEKSMRAPEEDFGEGTSRMEIISLDAALSLPFTAGTQRFAYETSFRGQWNRTPLSPQDRLSIGGRYTVRGFDGEMTLMAERGWYWRNDLSWQYLPNHRVYLGADVGRVSGPSAQYLLGQTLAGGVIGFKGQFKAGGQLYYDIFAGRPLYKPQFFRTARTTAGFNLNYSF